MAQGGDPAPLLDRILDRPEALAELDGQTVEVVDRDRQPEEPWVPSPVEPGWPISSRMTSPRRKNTCFIGAP